MLDCLGLGATMLRPDQGMLRCPHLPPHRIDYLQEMTCQDLESTLASLHALPCPSSGSERAGGERLVPLRLAFGRERRASLAGRPPRRSSASETAVRSHRCRAEPNRHVYITPSSENVLLRAESMNCVEERATKCPEPGLKPGGKVHNSTNDGFPRRGERCAAEGTQRSGRPQPGVMDRLSAVLPIDDRQRNLLSLLLAGHTDSSAARRLGVSPRTVANMLRSLMDRLGVENRFQLGVAIGGCADLPRGSSRTRTACSAMGLNCSRTDC
jgi:DNA-binding CsgD family transcriptional regulator